MGVFCSHGRLRSCSPAQRKDPRSHGTMPLPSRPRRPAAALRVGGNQNEAPSAGILRPHCSIQPVTGICMYGAADAPRTTTSYDQAFSARAEVVVDVGISYLRAHDCWRACFPGRGNDTRVYGATPLLSRPYWSAALLWVGRIQDKAPSAGTLRAPARFIPSQRYASTGPRMRSGRQLHTTKRLSIAPNSSQMLAWATREHTSDGGNALLSIVRRRLSPLLSCSVRGPAVGSR